MEENLFNALKQGNTVITANKRLSLYLSSQYAERQLLEGCEVWDAVDILPWSSWVERAFFQRNSRSELTLLDSHQAQFVWEQIIDRSAAGATVMQLAATARLARKAWQMAKQWQLPPTTDWASTNDETEAFSGWAEQFQNFCRDRHFIDRAELVDLLIERIRTDQAVSLPPAVWLAGFDEFLPQQEALFEALAEQDCSVHVVPFPAIGGEVALHACIDSQEEIALAARWARERLEADAQTRIAVVLPDPGQFRREIVRLFNEVFYPGALLAGSDPKTALFNLSVGQPLLDCPLIETALRLLSFLQGKRPIAEIGSLLRSPFLAASEQELAQRALLDRKLRQNGELSISLKRFVRLAKECCPILAEKFECFSEQANQLPTRASPSEWVDNFSTLLVTVGWPGERQLDSDEYQTVEAFRGLMESVALIDRIHSSMEQGEVLNRLRQMAGETLFQPESNPSPIQIMGPLEVAGEEFDHLWVMGLHDGVWPPASRPNPFIPSTIQRSRGVAHASAQREFHYIEKLTERLLGAAKSVHLSYPQRDGEMVLRASALLPNRAATDLKVEKQAYRSILFRSGQLESIADNSAPPLQKGVVVKGGAGHFKAQSACPFQAFARYRLDARELQEAEPGLDAMERGSLIHLALEKLWSVLQSQQQLLALEQGALTDIVCLAAKETVNLFKQRMPAQFSQNFCETEQRRLEELLSEWLEEEKQRAPFSLLAVEKKRQITVGPVKLDVVVDRMDQLEDGSVAIIDYKTGKPKLTDWEGARPNEPQLPLYGLFAGEKVSELLFAQVRKGEMRYLGLSHQAEPNRGIKKPEETEGGWDRLLEQWRCSLEQLAEEMVDGIATVSPKEGEESCQYCKLTPFCRIREEAKR